jgi:peroxiredoxin Q/BCP
MATTKKILAVGQTAPDFTPLTGQEKAVKSMTVLYFFPKVFTPVCTLESCAFRDMYPFFEKLNIQVVGITAGKPEELEDFCKQYHLPFPLLSDNAGKLSHQYQAWDEANQRPLRLTFALLPERKISAIFSDYSEDEEGVRLLIRDVKKHILDVFTL